MSTDAPDRKCKFVKLHCIGCAAFFALLSGSLGSLNKIEILLEISNQRPLFPPIVTKSYQNV